MANESFTAEINPVYKVQSTSTPWTNAQNYCLSTLEFRRNLRLDGFEVRMISSAKYLYYDDLQIFSSE